MCGICGFVGKNDKYDSSAVIESMKEAIIHRGPDDGGSYIDDGVALGFRRLSIIDLEGGAQPMSNQDNSLVIVFNGEIYNHEILAEELRKKGYIYNTRSDTETILHAYEEYGEDVLDKLRGMFAFVIYDKNKREIFAARDYFGIKPFYYALRDETFIFGSEIKAILKYPDMPREVNLEALEQYLSFQYSVLPETFFKGIFKLPPGHFIKMNIEDGEFKINRYFDPLLSVEKKKESLAKVVDDLDNVLDDSIKAHMISDVEVGASLSSGVDSSFIAAKFSGRRTYTVGFEDKDAMYNEIPYAEGLCVATGKENISRIISQDEYFDSLDDIIYYMDEPLADPSAVALYFVDELASRDIKVIMSGEGSDEFFGGYNIYHEPLSLRGYQRLPRGIRRGAASVARHMPKFYGKNFLIRASKSVEERFIGNANVFSYNDRRRLLQNPVSEKTPADIVSEAYAKCEGIGDIDKMQYIDINYWLVGDILLKCDKMSMAHSLEARVPFLDIKVFDYIKDLPVEYKVDDNETKKAFRGVARRHIPQLSADKKKLGFPVPIRRWLSEEPYRSVVADELHSDISKKYFKMVYIDKLLQDHYDGTYDNSRKIWAIYMFLKWHKVYMLA